MRCKIVKTQKLLWRNIMSSTKSQKASVLYYSIDVKKGKGKRLTCWWPAIKWDLYFFLTSYNVLNSLLNGT